MTLAPPSSREARVEAIRVAYETLQEAEALRLSGELEAALTLCAGLVARYPDHWAARHTLGLIHQDLQQQDEALDHLLRATILAPRNVMSLTALAGVCLAIGAREAAEAAVERAFALAPDDAGVHFMQGECLRDTNLFDRAAEAYRLAAEGDATLNTAIYKRGLCLLELGQRAQALGLFREAAAGDPALLGPIYELASFPPDEAGVDVLALLEGLSRPPHMPVATFEISRSFCRGTAWQSRGAHETAWAYFVAANRAFDASLRARARLLSDTQRESLARVNATGRLALAEPQTGQPVSLFILGCSRSGKTTVESLLGQLSGVQRGFETSLVQDSLQQTMQDNGLLTADTPGLLPLQLRESFAQDYAARLDMLAPQASIFTNTNPLLIDDVPKLLSVVTNARIVFVKRNVDDTCLRIYAQEYHGGNDYAYNLNDIREHVSWYHEMIDRLQALYPDIARVLYYEDMVSDPDSALRTVAELCGLPEPAHAAHPVSDDRTCSKPYRAWMDIEAARTRP